MRPLKTEVYIEQVEDGFEYKGRIHFGDGWKFEYRLECDKELDYLDKLAEDDLEAAKSQIHITLTKENDDNVLSIPDDLLPLFEAIVIPLALDFYRNPQTRSANSPETKLMEQMK